MGTRKIITMGAAVVAVSTVALLAFLSPEEGSPTTLSQRHQLARIAHAGGGYADHIYTNTLQALDANADHFDYFEIDLSWTSDRKLVCIHDWEGSSEKVLGRAFSEPPTLAEFKALSDPALTPCTIESLFQWVREHPHASIVTDIKWDNLPALTTIAEMAPDLAAERFIPQIYHSHEYAPVKALGYKNVIWTLYAMGGSTEEILKDVAEMDLLAVTMPDYRARDGLAIRLSEINIPTYVHTINSMDEASNFFKLGIDEIYTDWLWAR